MGTAGSAFDVTLFTVHLNGPWEIITGGYGSFLWKSDIVMGEQHCAQLAIEVGITTKAFVDCWIIKPNRIEHSGFSVPVVTMDKNQVLKEGFEAVQVCHQLGLHE